MSTDFVTISILVVTAFALGVFVGWLTWRVGAPTTTKPTEQLAPDRPRRSGPEGLPHWESRQVAPSEIDLRGPAQSRHRRATAAGQTIVLGAKQVFTAKRAAGRNGSTSPQASP